MTYPDNEITDAVSTLLCELLIWLEFYTKRDDTYGEYRIRLYDKSIESLERYPHLQKLYDSFKALFLIRFMVESHTQTEIVYGHEDVEMDFLGPQAGGGAGLFELMALWGEYRYKYQHFDSESRHADASLEGASAVSERDVRARYLDARLREGRSLGTSINKKKGTETNKAFQLFAEIHYPRGLDGLGNQYCTFW